MRALKWIFLGIPWAVFFIIKWVFIGIFRALCWMFSPAGGRRMRAVDRMDGWSFERYVARLLRKNRYRSVRVTKGSGDFGVDVIAKKYKRVWAFQCKNYSSKIGVAAVQEVYSGAAKYRAEVAVVVTNSYFTPHAKRLAESLGVLLWDRDMLENLALRRGFKKLSQDETDSLPCHIAREIFDP